VANALRTTSKRSDMSQTQSLYGHVAIFAEFYKASVLIQKKKKKGEMLSFFFFNLFFFYLYVYTLFGSFLPLSEMLSYTDTL
jgi:hypothetical protein